MSKLGDNTAPSLYALKRIVATLPQSAHLKVHTCYNLVVPPQWEIKDRRNEDLHILFIKGGKGLYTVEGRKIPFAKGQIILVSWGMLHSSGKDDADPPNIIPVRFGVYDNKTRRPVRFAFAPFCIDFVPHEYQEFYFLFEKLHRYYMKRDNAFYETLGGMALSEILVRMYSALQEKGLEHPRDPRVEKVRRFLDEHPVSRLDSDQLAGIAGLSEKYFRNLFKRQYGLTPKEYQVKVRVEYARFLLEEGRQNIKDVAWAAGYPDPYTFSKQFKQVLGYPPSKRRGE